MFSPHKLEKRQFIQSLKMQHCKQCPEKILNNFLFSTYSSVEILCDVLRSFQDPVKNLRWSVRSNKSSWELHHRCLLGSYVRLRRTYNSTHETLAFLNGQNFNIQDFRNCFQPVILFSLSTI